MGEGHLQQAGDLAGVEGEAVGMAGETADDGGDDEVGDGDDIVEPAEDGDVLLGDANLFKRLAECGVLHSDIAGVNGAAGEGDFTLVVLHLKRPDGVQQAGVGVRAVQGEEDSGAGTALRGDSLPASSGEEMGDGCGMDHTPIIAPEALYPDASRKVIDAA